MTDTAAPITRSERITNLDTVRGIATLGILVMNAVSFGLPQPAYFNLDYAGSDTALDWIVGVLGEVFVDQKTMAMFSMLFGAGIVVFADRAAAKGRRANWLSLWRNTLLLVIGGAHTAFWFGDVLMLYAVCSPVLLLLRTRSARTLFIAGGSCLALSALTMAAIQGEIEAGDLGDYWVDENTAMDEDVGFAFIVDLGMRALGAMLIGVGLFRADIIQGRRQPSSIGVSPHGRSGSACRSRSWVSRSTSPMTGVLMSPSSAPYRTSSPPCPWRSATSR